MSSVADYLVSALPFVLVMAMIAIIGVLAVRADGSRRGDPQSSSSRIARLEGRVEALEARKPR